MKASFLLPPHKHADSRQANIFANRSALVLNELLLSNEKRFTIQSLSADAGVSLGLAHKVVTELVREGIVVVSGVRTAKKYDLAKPGLLLKHWIEAYDITKKCRIRNYASGASLEELYKKLAGSGIASSVTLALHSAVSAEGHKFTNLETLELYVNSPRVRQKLEKSLHLEPQERGYQVLLIEPYYSDLLERAGIEKKGFKISPPLLTFLDLYHFPLRGQEQAEALLRKHPALNKIHKYLSSKNSG